MMEDESTQEQFPEEPTDSQPPADHSMFDLVYVGFNSRVVALDRKTGTLVWSWEASRGTDSYVAVLLDGDQLIVSVEGYTYALDPVTGRELWMNPLEGLGVGTPSLASARGTSAWAAAAALVEKRKDSSSSTYPPGKFP